MIEDKYIYSDLYNTRLQSMIEDRDKHIHIDLYNTNL